MHGPELWEVRVKENMFVAGAEYSVQRALVKPLPQSWAWNSLPESITPLDDTGIQLKVIEMQDQDDEEHVVTKLPNTTNISNGNMMSFIFGILIGILAYKFVFPVTSISIPN